MTSKLLYWRLSYGDESDETHHFRFCIYNPKETFQEFVKRICTKLSLQEAAVVPMRYHIKKPPGYLTITVNDQEDYQVLVANMRACEFSQQCTRGYELILRCSPAY